MSYRAGVGTNKEPSTGEPSPSKPSPSKPSPSKPSLSELSMIAAAVNPSQVQSGGPLEDRRNTGFRVLATIGAAIIVIAGLKQAQDIILPILIAAFLAVLSLPPVSRLQKRGVPDWAAVLVVFSTVMFGVITVAFFVSGSLQDFAANKDEYTTKLLTMSETIQQTANHYLPEEYQVSTEALTQHVDFGTIWSGIQAVVPTGFDLIVRSITGALSNILLVLLTLVFILAEAAGLPAKMRVAFGKPSADFGMYRGVMAQVQEYLRIKTYASLVTGVLAGTCVWIVGVDAPLLWGFVAFGLNFVPALGSILAGLPPVLLALVQYGWERALVILACYALINFLIGNVLEPRIMGRRLGLSPLVVFLSLVFWGWVWGPVGMLLSVPLTMFVKILLDQSSDLRWVGVMLGSGAESREVEAAQTLTKMKLEAERVETKAEPNSNLDLRQ